MDASDESLEVVFNALDSENKGYITVDQFLSVFNEYFQETNTNGRRVSTIRSDMKKVLEALDPTNDGIIHFEDFKKAFQSNRFLFFSKVSVVDEMQKVDESTNPQSTNFSPSTNPSKSGCFSDGLENKTDDSGIHTHETSIFDCDNDSSLSADGLTSSRLHRDEIRRSWPKQRGAPFLNTNNPDSPVSASRSDILIDDMETNLKRFVLICALDRHINELPRSYELDRRRNSEALQDAQDQLRTLQQQMSSLEAKHAQELQILRQDRDHAVHVLEELNGSMSERRRSRIGSHSPFSSSIAGGSEVIARYQESQEIVRRLIIENKSLRQQLEDAQDQLFARSLEEGRSLVGPTERSWAAEIDNCTKEEVRSNFAMFGKCVYKVLEELNGSMSERRRSRIGSHSPFSSSIAGGSEVIARYQESQEIVRRLIIENKSLRQQLEDAQDQLFARSLEEGRSLVGPTERSWAAEIDNCTKEEVIELYSKEKHFNEQLRKYIDGLITRIIERHPSLLEIASSAGK
ncbi:hypothetical protein AHF37_03956 [Paragonimus kellicotti]|nr:hypothetical protein AHF37_03956 [Paragonimus kellicotti]